MNEDWNIVYYQAPQQKSSPVYDFINNLDTDAKSKIINTINLLEIYGVRLGSSRTKKASRDRFMGVKNTRTR